MARPRLNQETEPNDQMTEMPNPFSGKFAEYKLEVTPKFRAGGQGTRELAGWVGVFNPKPIEGRTNITIDRSFIDQLNAKWMNRTKYFLDEDAKVPTKVIVTFTEDGSETTFEN